MLRYKVKLNEPKGYNEIICDELYLSPDMSYISGVTDISYGLINNQPLKIEFNGDNSFHDCKVQIKNVTRQGYVILNQLFKTEEVEGVKLYRYVDGKFYSATSETVNRNVTYWVEDGKIVIGENEYEVDIQLDKNGEPLFSNYITIKGGKQLPINDCGYSFWKRVTKFIIRKEDDYELQINELSCGKKVPYIMYNDGNCIDSSDNSKLYNYFEKKYYLEFKGDTYQVTTDDGKIFEQKYIENVGFLPKAKEQNGETEYEVYYEWRNSIKGDFLHIFLNMPQYRFTSAQRVIAESLTPILTKCDLIWDGSKRNKAYILYCGKKYFESSDTIDFLEIYGKEYKLHYTTNDKSFGYINFNNELILFKIENGEGIKISQHKNSVETAYKIIPYKYVDIDGDKFLVKKYSKVKVDYSQETPIEIEYVEVIRKERFILTIVDVINNSMLRCIPDVGINGDISGVSGIISSNYKKMIFKLSNPLFEEHNVTKESFVLSKSRGDDEVFDKIKLFNPSSYLKLPLIVNNDFYTNLQQEDLLKNKFAKEETKKRINPHIDMEREIYYPAYKEGNLVKLINEIQFYLHFRSRDLKEWKINEDVFEGEVNNKKCNWNIIDNYLDYDKVNTDALKPSILSSKINDDEFNYYQPSDLLYFLNFTTDDVFYQKSKISKSFLRLLFFDTNDIANQTLLYSCTVFMNENKLYKTYIDNVIKKDNKYVSVSDEINLEEVLESNIISVYNDTCDESGDVTFDEDKRLDSKFTIKNRYKSEESSEGFYLHIFKEYCENLHEKTIYMKVEFNHAGEGRTVSMLMPFRVEDEDNYELMSIGPNGNDLNEFKLGYPLKEIYKHMFIPINVVYNEEHKKYLYYLPEGLRKNTDKESVMKFNLYEIKIKDES